MVLLPNGTKAAVIAVAEDRSAVKVMHEKLQIAAFLPVAGQYVIDVAGEIGDLPRTACGNTGPQPAFSALCIFQGSALVVHALCWARNLASPKLWCRRKLQLDGRCLFVSKPGLWAGGMRDCPADVGAFACVTS